MGKHLVFYDGKCGLCDRAVQFVLNHDAKEVFDFAPFQGSTASEKLIKLPENIKNDDSLILIENYQGATPAVYILGKGAFRICWLLGGFWTVPGVISFLPSPLYNWGYRLVAKNRHKVFKNSYCSLPQKAAKHRFLP